MPQKCVSQSNLSAVIAHQQHLVEAKRNHLSLWSVLPAFPTFPDLLLDLSQILCDAFQIAANSFLSLQKRLLCLLHLSAVNQDIKALYCIWSSDTFWQNHTYNGRFRPIIFSAHICKASSVKTIENGF